MNPQTIIEKGTVNASEIVDDICEVKRLNNKAQQLNGTFADGTGANATILISYIVSSFIIITFAIVASIFIYRKKARQ